MGDVAHGLFQALQGPEALFAALRPAPDIVAAFTKRVAALGDPPPAPPAVQVDYLALLADGLPRNHKVRRQT